MNAIEADALLQHIARNSAIDPSRPVLPQLQKNYTPSFFNYTLYPKSTLKGRLSHFVHFFYGAKHTQNRVAKIARQAFAHSQTPIANPTIMQLGIEIIHTDIPPTLFRNPSIAPLENHLDRLNKAVHEKISLFSLLRPEAQRKRLNDCVQLATLPQQSIAQIQALIPTLTFDPKNLDSHLNLAELLQDLPESTDLTAIKNMVLEPVYNLSDSEFEAIIRGKASNTEFLQQWLHLHPHFAHPEWKQFNTILKRAEHRHQLISAQLAKIPTNQEKTEYLHNRAAVGLRNEAFALKTGKNLIFKGATGTRVASVQRLFQLVQQLPSEIIDSLPDIITSQEIYNDPPQYISTQIKYLVEQYSRVENLTPVQQHFLTYITENADRELSPEAIEQIRLHFPPSLQFLGDILVSIGRPIYKKGVISTLEKIDEYTPDTEAVKLLSLISRTPGINNTFVSGIILYYCSLLSILPNGKILEMLSWVRDNVHRFTDPALRESALSDLEKLTQDLAGKPIQSFLSPIINKVAATLHTLYKNVLSPNIALALTQMTGIEHPFLSAPFWIKITKQENGRFTIHIYGTGHSLYYFQGDENRIKWPRVIGNVPEERLTVAFFQRLLDHTYCAQYDHTMPSASEDLFGEQGTFETLCSDYDHPDTIENTIANDLFNRNSRTRQESRLFTRIIDTEWELHLAALSNIDPHLANLHISMRALVNYCRQFIDPTTEKLKLANTAFLEPLFLEIEKEFQRHEEVLEEDVKTIYEATLHDVRIALEAEKKMVHTKEQDHTTLPDAIANIIRRGMDSLGLDSDDILDHKRSLSWIFGAHTFNALEFLLTSADRASGVTLNETERTVVSDLHDRAHQISKLCDQFTTLKIQAKTVRDHLHYHQKQDLHSKIEEAERLRRTAKEDTLIWHEIYQRKIQLLLENPNIDAPSKGYLKESLKRVKRNAYRRYEIDLVLARVNERMENSASIQELYTIIEFCKSIALISRHANDLHRTLEKKSNFLRAQTAAQQILEHIPHNPDSEIPALCASLTSIIEKEHLAHSDFREAKNQIRKLKRICPPRLLPHANQLQDCVKHIETIERNHAPAKSFLQSIYYKMIFNLLDLVLNLVTTSSLARHLYNLFNAACNILPNTIGIWLKTAYKNAIRSIFERLFFLFLKFLIYKDLISIDSVQEIFSLKDELNLYAREILSSNQIGFTLPKHIVNLSVTPILKQFSRFCSIDKMVYTLSEINSQNTSIDTLEFTEFKLHFSIRDSLAQSREYPGFYIDPNQNDPAIKMYGSYLLLKNETGEKILLLPCADDLATASWNGLKNFGPIANPIGRLFPLVRAYTSLDSRKGKNLYHMYRLDARNRIVSNDAESLSYLITVQIIQGRMHDAIHTSEQLNNLLDEKENVEPDAEMVLWPLMVVPNTLEGKAALGPFNHIFHLRQKLLAKFELKCDKTKKPTNNSGFVHAIFIISLLQDLHTRIHKYRVERTPHPSDDPDQQEFLLYRTLHRHVSAIVTPDYHPVDWFESRLLPPSMAKRYRDLHLRYAGSTPNGTEHFLRDFAFSNAEPPTRSYFGAEASAFTDSPLQKMGVVEHIHSDQVNPTIWRRIHSMFRSHINAIRNPHLECASLQSTLELPRFNSSLSPSTVRTQFLHFYEIALGKNGSTARSNLYYNLRVMRGGWDLQSRTLIDLLTTVCSAALPTDKPLSTITAPLWRAWATGNSNSYQSFKWIGLHPLGIITSSIYGMVNHKIWSSNFTQAADSVTQFFGTGTNPPIDITLTSSTGALALPGHPSNQQIRMTAPLQHLNKTLQQITLEESPGRIAKIRILAKISMPPQTTEYVLFDDDLLVTHFPTPFLSSDGSPSFQIPHPLRQNYDEAIDNWPALDPRSYFPSPEILRTLIQGQLNPKCFFELLHSKVHAYKIVHTYTRPMQKGLVWLVENPFFSICGGKKGLYPLWMEIVHRAAAKALLAWRNYHVPVASNSYASLPIHFDLAELLTDENHRFERIYGKLTVKIFANGTALHRGQPLVALNAELEKLRRNLSESIVNDRKLLLKMVNPPTIRNIWRKPIDYKELLLSFFTNSYAGIMDDLKMHREQIHALQASIVRQITREIRLESIDKLLIRLNEISETGLIDLSALRLIKRFLSSHFYHTKMPEIQRHILCYEWLTGEIIQKEKLDEVKILVSDKKEYESLVRKALIKY